MAVLGLPEGVREAGLGTVGTRHLRPGPVVLVGDQDLPAGHPVLQLLAGADIHGEGEAEVGGASPWRRDVSGASVTQLLRVIFSMRFSRAWRVRRDLSAGQGVGQVLEHGGGLAQGLVETARLGLVQCIGVGEQDPLGMPEDGRGGFERLDSGDPGTAVKWVLGTLSRCWCPRGGVDVAGTGVDEVREALGTVSSGVEDHCQALVVGNHRTANLIGSFGVGIRGSACLGAGAGPEAGGMSLQGLGEQRVAFTGRPLRPPFDVLRSPAPRILIGENHETLHQRLPGRPSPFLETSKTCWAGQPESIAATVHPRGATGRPRRPTPSAEPAKSPRASLTNNPKQATLQ